MASPCIPTLIIRKISFIICLLRTLSMKTRFKDSKEQKFDFFYWSNISALVNYALQWRGFNQKLNNALCFNVQYENTCCFTSVNLPAQLSTSLYFPLVVFNSPSRVKSSSQISQTRQHNKRKEFFILFGAYGLPFRFKVFMKVLYNSLLRRRGYSKPPAWDIGPIYFPLTFFLHYVVCCASSQSAGSLSTLLSL